MLGVLGGVATVVYAVVAGAGAGAAAGVGAGLDTECAPTRVPDAPVPQS